MSTVKRWRGLKSLVHDAVDATVDLVGEGHESTARNVRRATDRVPELRGPARAVDTVRNRVTRGVLGSIKLTNRVVQAISDAGLDLAESTVLADDGVPRAVPMEDHTGSSTWVADAAVALVNAAVGDHLAATDNGLDIPMQLRVEDRYVPPTRHAIAEALAERPHGTALAVFVHGLGATEWSWCLEATAYHGEPTANFGTLLERDLGIVPLFVRYNTGRHISDNGRQLAALLDALTEARPDAELTLLGHSMGGLVLRSACAQGEARSAPFVHRVSRVFYLGSPHRGAPLAKLAQGIDVTLGRIDLPTTRILSRIVRGRSAGIADLRHGAIVDADWLAPLPEASNGTPLLRGAAHFFVSATVTEDAAHPVGRLIGDLLVRVPSASGPDLSCERTEFPIAVHHEGGVMHHQLQNHPAVYAQIRAACADTDA